MTIGEQDDNGNGFTAEEQSQFDAMRTVDVPGGAVADPAPAPDAGAGGEPPPAGEQPPVDPGAAPPAAAGAEDDDGGDDDGDDDASAGAEQQPDGQPKSKRPRRVSLGKFKAAEAERVRLSGELDAERQKQARLDERLKIINEALSAPPAPPAQEQPVNEDPEPELDADGSPVDIFKYTAWQRREMQRMNERFQGMQQQTQQRDDQQTVEVTYRNDAAAFAQTEPNFGPAYNHLMGARMVGLALYHYDKDLTEPGATLTQQQQNFLKAEIAKEERRLVETAIKQGRSPARMVFNMAKSMGFQPSAPAPKPAAAANGAAPPAPAANGQQPPARAAAQPQPPAASSAAADIARINNGQEAALSLSNGGGAPGQTLTAERLANMSDEEFAAYADELTPEKWQKVMGG